MNNEDKNIAYKVVERFFSDRFPNEIEEEIQKWLVDERNSSEKIEATQKLWETINIESDKSVYKSLNKVKERLGLSNTTTRRVSIRNYTSRVAAVLIPLFIVAGTYIYLNKSTETATITAQLIEISVPFGEQKEIILPDSSIVNINAGSSIRYTDPFTDNKRVVELSGEAYFSVTEDAINPFIVETKYLDIEVLGTEFNVDAYADGENTTVTLDKGKVQVKTPDEKLYTLDPNQIFVINNETNEVSIETVTETNTNWTSGELIFKDLPLKEIIRTLERRFNVSIDIANPSILDNDDIFTIKFREEDSLSNVLEIIEIVIGDISFKQIEKNKILLE